MAIRSRQQLYLFGCVWNLFWTLMAGLLVYSLCAGIVLLIFGNSGALSIALTISMVGMFGFLFWQAEYRFFDALIAGGGSGAFWAGLHLTWFRLSDEISTLGQGIFIACVGLVLVAIASWPTAENVEQMKKHQWRTC